LEIENNRNASIGLFVIGGLLLFGIGMFVIGDRLQVFARHTEYYFEFANLEGLVGPAPGVYSLSMSGSMAEGNASGE